jgi:hypothetical protein
MAAVLRTCQSCGDRRAIGEHRAYRSAGVVLRCPNCEDIALIIGTPDERLVVEWRGTCEIKALRASSHGRRTRPRKRVARPVAELLEAEKTRHSTGATSRSKRDLVGVPTELHGR